MLLVDMYLKTREFGLAIDHLKARRGFAWNKKVMRSEKCGCVKIQMCEVITSSPFKLSIISYISKAESQKETHEKHLLELRSCTHR